MRREVAKVLLRSLRALATARYFITKSLSLLTCIRNSAMKFFYLSQSNPSSSSSSVDATASTGASGTGAAS